MPIMKKTFVPVIIVVLALLFFSVSCKKQNTSDRTLYTTAAQFCDTPFITDYEFKFQKIWFDKTGEKISIIRSNNGTVDIEANILDRFETEVILYSDIWTLDKISKHQFYVYHKWRESYSNFPNNSCPMRSVPVLLVKKGNPLQIKSWDDLLRPDVRYVLTDPRTDSAGRFTLLSLWHWSMSKKLEKFGGLDALKDPAKKESVDLAKKETLEYIKKFYKSDLNLPPALHVNWSSEQFLKTNDWDVCLSWEFFALTKLKEKPDCLEIIYPDSSFLVDFPVAVNTYSAKKRNVGPIASEFIAGLFTPEIQEMLIQNGFRAINNDLMKKYLRSFPDHRFLHIDDLGGWTETGNLFFAPGGICEQIFGKYQDINSASAPLKQIPANTVVPDSKNKKADPVNTTSSPDKNK